MSRIEKNKLLSKINKYRNISLISFASFILTLIVTKIKYAPINNDVISIVILLSSIFIPCILSLFCLMMTNIYNDKLNALKITIKIKRHNLHFKLFWNLLKDKKYNEARHFYNNISLGHHKEFCEGLIMGMVHIDGSDKNWEQSVVERMNWKLK